MFGRLKKKELEVLELWELQSVTGELGYGDKKDKEVVGINDFMLDDRVPEEAREAAGIAALKVVYDQRKSAAYQEIGDLKERQRRELEELKERQRRERDAADGSIERLRERFRMNPA